MRAKLVVAACGAIHTPALLVRSGFRSPRGRIGHNLSMHPNVKVIAVMDSQVTGWKGAHQAYQVREFQEEGLVFASINLPPSLMAMSLPQRGRALGELMSQYDHLMLAGMLCEDTGDRPRAHDRRQAAGVLSIERSGTPRTSSAVSRCSELLFAAGAKRIYLPFHGAADLCSPDDARRLLDQRIAASGWEVLTVHMMGTAAMAPIASRRSPISSAKSTIPID